MSQKSAIFLIKHVFCLSKFKTLTRTLKLFEKIFLIKCSRGKCRRFKTCDLKYKIKVCEIFFYQI